TNRPGEAEPLYRRALKIDEASYGPDHPDVARDLNNLALLLHSTNRPNEAELLYRRALAIFEKSLGADHPNTVTARENLAALLAQLGRTGPSEPPKKGFLSRLFGGG
ncbi:tetratricopeptide repeat protein, partial [Roseiarcus sp.]|uniref:tetratricopeptide repeat protein n=1 Tax=Roseiarcus sp. TaxID=1969460 RepID=UPI003F983B7C